MDVMRIAGFSAAAAVAALILRRMRPELGAALALAAGALLVTMALPMLGQVAGGIAELGRAGGIRDETMGVLLKITGISLLIDFAAQTCRDAGEDGLALHTELAGRVAILLLALPTMRALLGQILALAP